MKKINKKRIIKAIEGSHGIKLTVIQKLGITLKELNDLLQKYPDLKDLLKQEKSNILDFSESRLLKAVENGEAWAIRFILLNQGQARGYGNRNFKLEEIREKFSEVVINFISPRDHEEKNKQG